ncbi:MAG: fumarylacetoacetate hydrolase family protein [Halobacteria archaeon]|nr:fumarylacetoacetate hydrolase family protein [Halobacteria archaeon]
MLEARFEFDGEVYEGVVVQDEILTEDAEFPIGEVEILPPSVPSKVVAVGMNYAEHAEELGSEVPDFPLLFFKPPSSVIGHGDVVEYPETTDRLEYEGEIGVVIDSRCKDVSVDEAAEYIRGYTCVNDVTARDWQEKESQWARAKGMDGFCPVGPFVQTDLSDSIGVETVVNGEVRQSANTDDTVFSIPEIVSEVSRFMTLEEGDVIATGTPEGVGEIERGDTVEVEVEDVGTLSNEVV